MLALLEDPDQLDLLGEAGPTHRAVEELLRWVSPVKNMSRTATRDVVIRGQRLHEGDQLILFYPSANRDEAVFDDPDRSTSGAIPTLIWPSGSAPLLPGCRPGPPRAPGDVRSGAPPPARPHSGRATLPYRESNFVSGLEAMPVRFTPSPSEAS